MPAGGSRHLRRQALSRRGVARAGLEGALAQIAAAGGGLVEAISEVTAGREAHSRFLFSATAELFEQHGFTRGRQVGKPAWILSREITRPPRPDRTSRSVPQTLAGTK